MPFYIHHHSSQRIKKILYFCVLLACSETYYGQLEVQAPMPGEFEIFRMNGRQFVAEGLGEFNKPLSLAVGSYLILADCSNRLVVIRPDHKTLLNTHTVQFTGPNVPTIENSLSIQCVRNSEIGARQVIQGRYVLNVISDSIDFLIGTKALTIDLRNSGTQKKNVELAALQVNQPDKNLNFPYFVSPDGEMIAATQVQHIGEWLMLAPGAYHISLNGTSQSVNLAASESVSIMPSILRFEVPENEEVAAFEEIRGRPFSILLNEHYPFYLNETVAVLSGKVKYRLANAKNETYLDLEPGKQTTVHLKTLWVHSGCSPWEWECLGRRNIRMFHKNQIYQTIDSVTDVPTFFELDEMSVSLEGSYGLKRSLADLKTTDIKTGGVVLVPYHVATKGSVTEFMRIEAPEDPMHSYSRDIPFERVTACQ